MVFKAGVWIDHRRAEILTITENGKEAWVFAASKVEKQLRRTGDSPLKGSYDVTQVPASDRRQNAYTEHLNPYYNAVIANLNDAEAILIFGPGEAKYELKAHLEHEGLGDRIAACEASDKLTRPQLAEKVRRHRPHPATMGV
jgi:hypothetical protein